MRHLSTGQSPSLQEMRAALPVFGPILKGSWVVNKGSFKGSFKGIYRDSIRVYHNTAFLVASHPGPPPPRNPEPRIRTQDPGPGTRNPEPGTRKPTPGFGTGVPGLGGAGTETRNPEPGTPEPGNPAPGTRNPEPGTGNREAPRTRNREDPGRNPGPGTRNPGPGPLRARKTISPRLGIRASLGEEACAVMYAVCSHESM